MCWNRNDELIIKLCDLGLASTGSQRSNSPVRSWSPTRLERYVAEVDPETVRIAMVDFIQQLKDTERERDEFQVAIKQCQRQLQDMEEDRNRLDHRLAIVIKIY